MEIGENIKNLRIKNNLTQKDLADRLFVTPQAVSRWENGETSPSVDVLDKMRVILNCELTDIIYGDGKEAPKPNETVVATPPETRHR